MESILSKWSGLRGFEVRLRQRAQRPDQEPLRLPALARGILGDNLRDALRAA